LTANRPAEDAYMTTDDGIFDLVIVGLGPVGGAAANLAGEHGLRTLAIDLAPEVHPLPRAIHFDADAMRILQAAGVARDVVAITRQSTGSVHLGMDGDPIRDFRVPDAPGDLGWSPHYLFFQPELDGLLRRRAAQRPDVDVRLGWKCDEVGEDAEGVRST
jgi:3-(3-hydroxy-phenyl)propionate hydroxylase